MADGYVPGLYPSRYRPVRKASGLSGIREAVHQGKLRQEAERLKKEIEQLEQQLQHPK